MCYATCKEYRRRKMNNIKLFEDKKIRSHYDEESEKWFFSVVDVVGILSESENPRKYWSVLKTRLKNEGSEMATNCSQLKLKATDGKFYLTDVADAEQLLRLIQSIPSPKAEPFKLWLAKVGYERIQDMSDPSLSVDRARAFWKSAGRSEKWIQQRMMGQETRNKLTDYWSDSGVEKPSEFALLTNIIHQEWSGLSVQKHKAIKGLKSQNLRDHMSEAKGVNENAKAGKKGGGIAKKARLELENQTGKSIVTGENFLPPKK